MSKSTPTPYCSVCHSAGKSKAEYTSHYLRASKAPNAKTTCPYLLAITCGYCKGPGHTPKYCPVAMEKNKAHAQQVKAQAQAQARAQGSKAFENLVADGLAFQRKSQVAAQEKLHEAAAHFNQLTQGLGAGLVQPMGAKVDRLEHLFEDRVARALKSLGLPTAQEVADLQERVTALEAALGKKAPVKSKKSPA